MPERKKRPRPQRHEQHERDEQASASLPLITSYKEHKARWAMGCGAEECARARNVVFGRGKIPADVLFLGEGPGKSEDFDGKPFVGPAGELLQRIIDDSVPENVRYVLYNCVGCMPTDEEGLKSGEPTEDQLRTCRPRLQEFIRLANPKLIVSVGRVAADWLDTKAHWHCQLHADISVIEIKHPAAILRSTIATRGLQIQECIVRISNTIADNGIGQPGIWGD